LADRAPELAPERILRMATVNAAQALGHKGVLGELSENALADLIAVPFTGRREEVLAFLVHYPGEVAASMIGGVWAIPPPPA